MNFSYPEPSQPLHSRRTRLTRFLANPRLDELALSVHWLGLSFWIWTPLWRSWPLRYRLKVWWADSS